MLSFPRGAQALLYARPRDLRKSFDGLLRIERSSCGRSTRLGLSPRNGSYLLEEFAQLLCVGAVFGVAARNFATVFRQQVPVDTLEAIARRMGAAAELYSDDLPRLTPTWNCRWRRWTTRACR